MEHEANWVPHFARDMWISGLGHCCTRVISPKGAVPNLVFKLPVLVSRVQVLGSRIPNC